MNIIDNIEVLKSNIVDLENSCSKLETMNEESVNKLNILTKFFKEQEQEYLKCVLLMLFYFLLNCILIYNFSF